MTRFTPSHISSLLSSFAKLGYRPTEDLLGRLLSLYLDHPDNNSITQPPSFPQHARLLAALVSLDYQGSSSSTTSILDSFHHRLSKALDRFSVSTDTSSSSYGGDGGNPSAKSSLRVLQEVSTGLWALAVWGPLTSEWSPIILKMVSLLVRELERQHDWWPEGWEGTRYGADLKASLRRIKQATLTIRLWDDHKGGGWKGEHKACLDEWLQVGIPLFYVV